MRMRASWLASLRPTGYKVVARTPRAPTASSPRTRHPDHNQRAAVLGSVKARPGNDGACGQRRATADLDSPCARRPSTCVGRGEETGFKVEQRNWYEGSGECREIVLDFESLIQGLLGVHSRYGLHTRAVTVYRDAHPEGFSYFVTSIAAPVASGWSNCRVGFTPTGKRRLSTAHTH